MAFSHISSYKKLMTKKGKDTSDPVSTRRMKHALTESFHPILTKEKAEFRASSLPFCPILHIDAAKRNQAGVKLSPSVGWKDNFYLELGKRAHTLWQRVLTRAARDPKAPIKVKPFGGWQCTHCKRELSPQFLPEPCNCEEGKPYSESEFIDLRLWQNERKNTKQNIEEEIKLYKDEFRDIGGVSDWDYVEVGIEYRGFSGHVDYIEYYPEYDEWVIWDLKTAMSHAVDRPVNKLPVLKNVFQIETYCALLPELYPDITHVSEYSLLYHTRESASKWFSYRVEWDDAREDRTWRRIDRWCNGFAYAQEYLGGKRHNPDVLLDVIDVRPCISVSSWEREQLPAFVYDDVNSVCPYLSLCTTCESQSLVRKVYSLMEDRIQEHIDDLP